MTKHEIIQMIQRAGFETVERNTVNNRVEKVATNRDFDMKIILLSSILAFCLVVAGYAQKPQGKTGDFQNVVKKEVESTIRSFLAGFGKAKCEDVTPVSKFVRDHMIYVVAKDIYTLSLADYEQGVRDRACKWVSHAGVVESVVVDALTRDTAVAAWMYHDEVTSKSGEIKKTRGSVLMTLIRSGKRWKITSTMSLDERVQ